MTEPAVSLLSTPTNSPRGAGGSNNTVEHDSTSRSTSSLSSPASSSGMSSSKSRSLSPTIAGCFSSTASCSTRISVRIGATLSERRVDCALSLVLAGTLQADDHGRATSSSRDVVMRLLCGTPSSLALSTNVQQV